MSRKSYLLFGLVVAVGILVFTGLFGGCSQNPTSSPANPIYDPAAIDSVLNEVASYPVVSEDGLQPGSDRTPSYDQAYDTNFFEDSERIHRSTGGTITLSKKLPGYSYFFVPPNAIPFDTTITIRTWQIESGNLNLYEFHFLPEGLKFHPNATFVLDAEMFANDDGELPSAIVWMYYNKATKQWDLETVLPISNDGYFHVPVYHFSIYRAGVLSFGLSPGGE